MEDNKSVQENAAADEMQPSTPVEHKIEEIQDEAQAKVKALHEQLIADQKKAEAELQKELAKRKNEFSAARQKIDQAKAKAAAELQKADVELEAKLTADSKTEGQHLEQAAKELNIKMDQFDEGLDQKSEEFTKRAEEKLNAVRRTAEDTIDGFANEMQQDPKQALIEAAKAGLMIIGAIALLKGLFRR
ncbi:hypothetical protein IM774_03510 [Erysipelotrichaceae bacterium RD49]|nr:hypothetical protein [Erysipelotrichaceae bacterium RD49]